LVKKGIWLAARLICRTFSTDTFRKMAANAQLCRIVLPHKSEDQIMEDLKYLALIAAAGLLLIATSSLG
jgi:hypothetical protein